MYVLLTTPHGSHKMPQIGSDIIDKDGLLQSNRYKEVAYRGTSYMGHSASNHPIFRKSHMTRLRCFRKNY